MTVKEARGRVKAVSYTHLDVYKRQVINYVIVGLLGGLLVDWLMEVSASRLLLIGAAIGLVIGVIDYRLSAARWNRYVAGLEVRFPTLPDREDLQST